MHGFDLSRLQKAGFALGYFVILIGTYLAVGRDLSNIGEVFRLS